MRAPLLVIDGDSFAHRAYHALPKTIRRAGGKGAGAILGFANYLLRSIATMDKTAPLPPLRSQKPSWEKAGELARRWQLRKLAERLEALGLQGASGSQRWERQLVAAPISRADQSGNGGNPSARRTGPKERR
jgi:hypothetical protein